VKVAYYCPEHGVKRLNHRKEIQVSGKRFENLTSIQLAAAEITGGVVLPPTFWGTGPFLPGQSL